MLLTAAWKLISGAAVLAIFAVGVWDVLLNLEPNLCQMTYMFEYPNYVVRFPSNFTIFGVFFQFFPLLFGVLAGFAEQIRHEAVPGLRVIRLRWRLAYGGVRKTYLLGHPGPFCPRKRRQPSPGALTRLGAAAHVGETPECRWVWRFCGGFQRGARWYVGMAINDGFFSHFFGQRVLDTSKNAQETFKILLGEIPLWNIHNQSLCGKFINDLNKFVNTTPEFGDFIFSWFFLPWVYWNLVLPILSKYLFDFHC